MALMNLSGIWIGSVYECAPLDELILDLDSPGSPTHGEQQGSAYNGYFECTCYHPLFLFKKQRDVERGILRRGNHNGATLRQKLIKIGAKVARHSKFVTFQIAQVAVPR